MRGSPIRSMVFRANVYSLFAQATDAHRFREYLHRVGAYRARRVNAEQAESI